MNVETIETSKGPIALYRIPANETIETVGDFFDALMSAPSRTVAFEATGITAQFFDLKTGFAGEILQKVSNYRRRLIVLGDFSTVESKSLRDFIFESNRTGQVVFASTLDLAVELLRG